MFLGCTSSQGCAHEVKHKSQEPLRDPSTKRSPKRKEEGLWQDWDVQNVRAVPVLGECSMHLLQPLLWNRAQPAVMGQGEKIVKKLNKQENKAFPP